MMKLPYLVRLLLPPISSRRQVHPTLVHNHNHSRVISNDPHPALLSLSMPRLPPKEKIRYIITIVNITLPGQGQLVSIVQVEMQRTTLMML